MTLGGKAMKEWRGLRRILGDSWSERTNNQFEEGIPTTSNNLLKPSPHLASCLFLPCNWPLIRDDAPRLETL